jgi:tripartite-type tricarboxylate transporter receptor subunit TctC
MGLLIRIAGILACVLASAGALAQGDAARGYPSKPVRLIIPFAAGGGNDVVGRVVAAKLTQAFGQSVIVENRPGANGFIGAKLVVDAAPDGYTILMGPSGPIAISPAIFSKMPYSPLKDLAPVTMIGSYPLILVVSQSLPARTVAELVQYARARPNQVNYGSTAATFQLTSELFNLKTGTRFEHIPYKSSAEFTTAAMTGEVTIAFADPMPAIGLIKSGKIRGLAVTAAARHPFWPDVPTMAEAGIADMEVTIFMGLFLPAATPRAIVQRLRDEVAKGIAEPDVREKLVALGVAPAGNQPDEFAKFLAEDTARWTTVARTANIKAD